jgi:hypothetical protein
MYKPGPVIVVDESMGRWRGLSGKVGDVRFGGTPHVTKIKRKPRGVGVEFKNVCCGEKLIMLQLEIQESKR